MPNQPAWPKFTNRSNNSTSLADLAGGLVDAVLVHSLPEDSGFWFSPVAMDGLVIVVHPTIPFRH